MNDMRPSPKRTTPPAAHGGRQAVSPMTPGQRPTQRRTDSHKTISINLSLPHTTIPKPLAKVISRFKRISRKRKLVLLIGVIALVVLIAQVSARMSPTGTSATAPNQQNPLDMLEKGTPDYTTLVPANKKIEDLNGWTRVSPKDRDPVYAYVDRIKDTPISVSQQPLPKNLQSNTDKNVESIALASNATKKITAGGVTVYLGASSKGAQPAVFAKDGLLVLIKATNMVPDKDWKSYIDSLR